jgi:hypothetical protein
MRLRPSHRFALKADPYSGTAQHGTAKHSCTNLESDIHTSTYFNCMVFWEQNTSSDAHVRPATHLIKCTFTAWISWLHCQSFAPTISIGKAVQKTSEDHKKTSVLHCSLGPRPSAMCSNDQKACEAQCLKRPFYLQALLWKISRRTATSFVRFAWSLGHQCSSFPSKIRSVLQPLAHLQSNEHLTVWWEYQILSSPHSRFISICQCRTYDWM